MNSYCTPYDVADEIRKNVVHAKKGTRETKMNSDPGKCQILTSDSLNILGYEKGFRSSVPIPSIDLERG